MRAWVYRKDKADSQGIHIFEEEIPIPSPGKDQVLVRVLKVSVCGTDESLFRGDLKKVPDGVVPGHEFYGEIVELGSDTKSPAIGTKIAGESHYQVPGTSDQGIIGVWGPEIRKDEFLAPIHGGYAEYLCIPAECAHPVAEEQLSPDFWPSLFEAIGNDYYLVKRVREIEGLSHLGVFGCGPHGLFAQIFARNFEIPHITAFETDSFRRDFAANMQIADHVLDPSQDLIPNVKECTGGKLFDVTLDMVGKQGQGFDACCRSTKDGGTIFLFGLFTDRFSIDNTPGNEIIFHLKSIPYSFEGKKLRVIGITGREGIWQDLIATVCQRKDLQEMLMRPVRVMGSLDRLGEDTRNPKPGILKRAYHHFGYTVE